MVSWKELEGNVKSISQFKWNCSASPEHIYGVNFDCVLKPSDDRWIIIEATENNSLEKVRADIVKHNLIRLKLISDGLYSLHYIVLSEEPTLSMVESGSENRIKVMSYKTFSSEFLDFQSYANIRSERVFGSSFNPFSGKKDELRYTPVEYKLDNSNKQLELRDISKLLINNERIVLLGNYGTGKSRCVRELFQTLVNINLIQKRFLYPIAINLKDNWGTKRAEEIIRRHFDDLGLSNMSDAVLKLMESDRLVFLLDGFDEIAAQVWSSDSSKLSQIRAASLSGIKDLIQKTKGSILISGREHYFNSHKEMFRTLGLDPAAGNVSIITCKDEFTEEEMSIYMKSLSKYIDLPMWLPRRPLIWQIISEIGTSKVEEIFIDASNSTEFWKTLIRNICDREAKIQSILDSDTIFNIFVAIAEITRTKNSDLGPLSISEINLAFEEVVGTPPVDESAVMLQRLPALGRISPDSTERQFIDYYILDGLRAENLISYVEADDTSVLNDNWQNCLGELGIDLVAKRIADTKSANFYINFLKKSLKSTNKIIAGDLLAALARYAKKNILDLGGLTIEYTRISILNLSNSLLDNFSVKNSEINVLDVSACGCSRISIVDCFINSIHGVAAKRDLPSFVEDNEIEKLNVDPVTDKSKSFSLTPSQMVFISLIKKIFISLTHGKSEHELLSKSGTNKELTEKLLALLTKEKIIAKSRDSEGSQYTAKSYAEQRIQKILRELNKSKDELWHKVTLVK